MLDLARELLRLWTRLGIIDGSEIESPAEDDIHPVMLALLQLDADQPGSIRPKVAAQLCGHDPDLLLQLISWNEEQPEIAWRAARDEARAAADFDEAEVCEGEREHAQRTTKALRKALRRVLLQETASPEGVAS